MPTRALLSLAAVSLALAGPLAPAGAAADTPNIVVIMADDVGWSDLSCYHQGVLSNRTPNLDRLAAEGTRFTDYYAQPTCTAGRSAFVTGQYPVRTGLHTVGLPGDPIGLAPGIPTLADLLRAQGYRTGQFGKNHLGDLNEFLPTAHGFDEYWGWLYHLNAMEYVEDFDWPEDEAFTAEYGPRNIVHAFATEEDDDTVHPRWGRVGKQRIEDDGPCTIERMRTLDDEVSRHALDFIDRSVEADEPFFLWVAPARAHVWTHLSPEYEAQLGQDGKGLSAVVLQDLDDTVGEVLAKLEAHGIADDTIVVFTSDNGPEILTWPDGGMTPFHGEKGTTWEGGVRVPAIVRWPDHVPAGRVSNGIFDAMDWLPTLVAAAGGPADVVASLREGYAGFTAHLDGYNQLDHLRGGADSARKEVIYYEGKTLQAVRYNDWKAHFVVQPHGWAGPKEKLNAPLLVNLRRDPYERAFHESGMYTEWMGQKMWTFGPAKRIVMKHLASFQQAAADGTNHDEVGRAVRESEAFGR